MIEDAVLTLVNCNVLANSNIVLKNATLRLRNSKISAGSCLVETTEWAGIAVEGKGSIYLYDDSVIENARFPIASQGGDDAEVSIRVRGNGCKLSGTSPWAVNVTGWLDMRAENCTIDGAITSKVTGSIPRGPGVVVIKNSQINQSVANGAAFDLMGSHLRLDGSEINGFSKTLDSDDSPHIRIAGCHLTEDGTSIVDRTSENFVFYNNLIENGVVVSDASNYYSVKQNEFVSSEETISGCTSAICLGTSNNTYNRFEGNIFNDKASTSGDHGRTQFLCNVFDSAPGENFRWDGQVNTMQLNNEYGAVDDMRSAGNLFSGTNSDIAGSSPGTVYFYDGNNPIENPVINSINITKDPDQVLPSPCGEAGINWLPPVLVIDPSPAGPNPGPSAGPTVSVTGCPVGIKCTQACPTGINCNQNCPPGINCFQPCPLGIICTVSCPSGIDCTQPCPPGIDCTQPCPPGVDCTQPCPPGIDCTVPCYRNCSPCVGPNCYPITPEKDEVLQWVDNLYLQRESQLEGLQREENNYLTQLILNIGLHNKEDILNAVQVDNIKPTNEQLLNLFDKSKLFTESEMVSIVAVFLKRCMILR